MRLRDRFFRFSLLGIVLMTVLWQFNNHRTVSFAIESESGEGKFISMPLKDKKILETYFKEELIFQGGIYSFFKAKPMSLLSYQKPFDFSNWREFVTALFPSNLVKYRGWKTLKKYQHFINDEFIIWEEPNPFFISSPSRFFVIVVHKPSFLEIVNTYLEDFQKVLDNSNISGNLLLQSAQEKPFLKEVLRQHDGLIGTLLGYGRNNAWAFEARAHGTMTSLAPLWEEKIDDFMRNRYTFSTTWLCRFPEDVSLYLAYPSFLADPHSIETLALKKKLLLTREKIIRYYKGKDFFDATLKLLIANPRTL